MVVNSKISKLVLFVVDNIDFNVICRQNVDKNRPTQVVNVKIILLTFKNRVILFKRFGSNQFNNLIWTKTEQANVKRKL